MTDPQEANPPGTGWRRKTAVVFWKVFNPLNKLFAGWAPWWVLLETTGRVTGRRRRTPLAAGPRDETGMWLLAVHGRHSAWVKNIEAASTVRVRHVGGWRAATATVHSIDADVVGRFNRYARTGPRIFGIDPTLVRLEYNS